MKSPHCSPMPRTFAAWARWAQRHASAYRSLGNIEPYQIPIFTDPDMLVHYLQGEAALYQAANEEAIESLIATGHWPSTALEARFYLMQRLAVAAFVLNEARRDAGRYSTIFPGPKNAPDFLRWLLIDVWNQRGMLFLECWAESFLEERAKGK